MVLRRMGGNLVWCKKGDPLPEEKNKKSKDDASLDLD
jgi:hypothetical protein